MHARTGSKRRGRLISRGVVLLVGTSTMLLGSVVPQASASSTPDFPNVSWVGYSDYPYGSVDGADRSYTDMPLMQVEACYPDGEFQGQSATHVNYTFEIELLTSEENSFSSGQLTALPYRKSASTICASASWQVQAPLSEGVLYQVRGRTVVMGDDFNPWVDGSPMYVVPIHDPPLLVAPANAGLLAVIAPQLTVATPDDLPGDKSVEFQLWDAVTNVPAASGTVLVTDETTTWTVPHALAAGSYAWRARSVDYLVESDWSEDWTFSIGPPTVPVLVSPLTSAVVSDPRPVLVATLSDVVDRPQSGIFRVVRKGSEELVAKGRALSPRRTGLCSGRSRCHWSTATTRGRSPRPTTRRSRRGRTCATSR